APVPDWIIARLNREPQQPTRPISGQSQNLGPKVRGLIRLIASASEGERNRVVFWAGCRFAEMIAAGGLTRNQALGLILSAASECGLSQVEARRTAESAFRRCS